MMGEEASSAEQRSWRNSRRTVATVCDAFVLAENIQLVAAEIYASLSHKLSSDPELRALFALLGGEERSRAGRVREAARRCRERGGAADVKMDALRLRLLLAQMEKCHTKTLHALSADADCALKLARLLEQQLSVTRAEALVGDGDPELVAELVDLSSEDHAHAALGTRLAGLDGEQEAMSAEQEWLLADLTATGVPLP